MGRGDWEHFELPLHKHHSWTAPEGYKVFVAGRGAARFNVPREWVFKPTDDCLRLYDRAPPDDERSIGFTLLQLPPIQMPASELVSGATTGQAIDVLAMGDIQEGSRPGLDLAWRETRFRDADTGRDAFSRLCVARAGTIGVLITLEFWATDVDDAEPVWQEVLRSLVLGQFVTDPARGDVWN